MSKKRKNKVSVLTESMYRQYIFNITGEDADDIFINQKQNKD